MFESLISRLPQLSVIDVEAALSDTFDTAVFRAFETQKAAGTLNEWFNVQLSAQQRQQVAKFMEGRQL